MDPAVQHKLRHSKQAREDFKALHHRKHEIDIYDPETGNITTTHPKKRPFEEGFQAPELVTADKQMQQAMMEYHQHQVLPGIEHLTQCCQNFYGTVSQEILFLQHMSDRQSMQLKSLEQSRCNKTILLKNLPPVGFTKSQLDRNVKYLLQSASMSWDRIAAMHNHVVTTDAAVLRLEFITEEDAKTFFQSMKRRKFHWSFNGQQEAKIRVEHDQPVEDRLALQPFYALVDLLSPHFGNDQTLALQMDKNTLQVWPGSERDDQTMLAQVSYHLDPNAPRRYLCTILVRDDLQRLVLNDFHSKFHTRMKSTLQLTQALARATQDRTTAARHSWQKSFDTSNTPNALKAFPYQINFLPVSSELVKLLETHPALPLQGAGGLTAVVAQAFQDYGINVDDYGKGKGKKTLPAPPSSQPTKGKGIAKGNSKGRQQPHKPPKNWQDRSPDQTWYPSNRRPDGNNDPQQDSYQTYNYSSASAWPSRQRPYHTAGKGSLKGKQRTLTEVILCKLCLCALGVNRLCQHCWKHDIPAGFDQRLDIQSFQLYCPGQQGSSCCNQLLGFGSCALCSEHRNSWKSQASYNVHQGFSPFEKAAHLVLDKALYDVSLPSWDTSCKNDWLSELRDIYDQNEDNDDYSFAEWTLLTYDDLKGLETLPQSGQLPYSVSDWVERGQLPSHGMNFGESNQPLLPQTFWTAYYYSALLTKWYQEHWSDVVPGYSEDFFATFDVRFSALIPWDHMVAASYKIALIHEGAARQQSASEPFPDQWCMNNIEWLVERMLDEIPSNEDVFDYLARQWAVIINGDELVFDLFVGNPPYSNAVVRDFASFATYYSDLVYWQFSRLFSFALPKQAKAQVQCPNYEMNLLYDRIVQYLDCEHPKWVLQRGSNNKGNIIEALFLYFAEHGFHTIIFRTMWAILQHQAKDGHYPWLVAVAH